MGLETRGCRATPGAHLSPGHSSLTLLPAGTCPSAGLTTHSEKSRRHSDPGTGWMTCATTYFLSACYAPDAQHTTVSVLGVFLAGKATVLPDTLCDIGVPRKEKKRNRLTHPLTREGKRLGPFNIFSFWLPFVGMGDPGGRRTGLVWGPECLREATRTIQKSDQPRTRRSPSLPPACWPPRRGEARTRPPRPVSSGRGAERTTRDVRPLGLVLSTVWHVPNPPTEPTPRLSPILPTTKLHGT